MRRYRNIVFGVILSLLLIIIPIQVHATVAIAHVDNYIDFDIAMANSNIETIMLEADIAEDSPGLSGREIRSLTGKKIIDVNGYQFYGRNSMYYGYTLPNDYEGDTFELVLKDSSPNETGLFLNDRERLFLFWNNANLNEFTFRIESGNFKHESYNSMFWIINQGDGYIPNKKYIVEGGNFEGKGSLLFFEQGTTVTIKKLVYSFYEGKGALIYTDTKLKNIIDANSDLYVDGLKYEQLDNMAQNVEGETFEVVPKVDAVYDIIVQNDGHGTASANPSSAKVGKEVTLTASANNGYEFKEWQVISGGVTITNNKFTMPNREVKIKAIFAKRLFSDVSISNSFYHYISELYQDGIISGYSDGTFKPNNPLTRAQAAKMIVLAAGIDTTGATSNFKDVKSSSSSYEYISAAYRAGIIGGYEDGTIYKPNQPVTRAQIAKMVTIAFGLEKQGNPPPFVDVEKLGSANTREYIYTLSSLDIVKGYGDEFRPYNNVTRGQFSKIVILSREKVMTK